MSLQDTIKGLESAVGDLTSLSVETYTGKISADIQSDNGDEVVDWTKLVEQAKKGGTINLVLASKFYFDGDATQFIASGDIPNSVTAAHDSAVKAGQTVRASLMELLSDSIKKLV